MKARRARSEVPPGAKGQITKKKAILFVAVMALIGIVGWHLPGAGRARVFSTRVLALIGFRRSYVYALGMWYSHFKEAQSDLADKGIDAELGAGDLGVCSVLIPKDQSISAQADIVEMARLHPEYHVFDVRAKKPYGPTSP